MGEKLGPGPLATLRERRVGAQSQARKDGKQYLMTSVDLLTSVMS